MRRVLPGALILLALAPSRAAETGWHQSTLPHFIVATQSARKPSGFDLGLERIHRRLRFDLAMFSPWISKEQVKLYLYRDQKAYAEGEFKPPPWSNGLALYDSRAVLVFEQETDKKLMEIIGHETTHLLFESYWGEVGKEPPAWLNEGLAMMEEVDSLSHPEASEWYRAMVELPGHEIPLSQFFETTPTKDLADTKDKDKVGVWYAQAFSTVYFLFRTHSKLQFQDFCRKLREGQTVQEALWQAYRIRDEKTFQKQWLSWLKEPFHRRKIDAALQAEGSASSEPPGDERHKIRGLKDGFQTKIH
ncbi:MAG: hypothetical protein HY077_12445 [Elusimicrobia bacterium]|nr:hypothetical protein [Elusimicrobiota bacterium]